jgi:hypothetical protein
MNIADKLNGSPGPNRYTVKSDLDPETRKNRGISFGNSRDVNSLKINII